MRTFSGQAVDRPVERALQHLVARVAGLEGEVVGEDDELERLRLHLVDDGGEAHEVVLVHLDDPQPLVRVGVEQGADERGLAGAAHAPQQRVVGRAGPARNWRVFSSTDPLLRLDAEEVVEVDAPRCSGRAPSSRRRCCGASSRRGRSPSRSSATGLGRSGSSAARTPLQPLGQFGIEAHGSSASSSREKETGQGRRAPAPCPNRPAVAARRRPQVRRRPSPGTGPCGTRGSGGR